MIFISLIVWLSLNFFWGKALETISPVPASHSHNTTHSCPRGHHFVPDTGKCVRLRKVMTGGNDTAVKNCPDRWLTLQKACVKIYRYVERLFDCDTGNLLLTHIINCQNKKKPKKVKKKSKCRKGAKDWDPATKKCVPRTTTPDPQDDIDD